MKLLLYNCDNKYLLLENKVTVLEIENSSIFRNVLNDFTFCNFPAQETAIMENLQLLKSSDILCLVDFINKEYCNKSIISKLYKFIESEISSDILMRANYEKIINNFLSQLEVFTRDIDIELNSNINIEPKDVFSFIKLSPFNQDDDLVTSIIQIIKLCSLLKIYKVIILVNLKSYLTESECVEIYKNSLYYKIPLILIECCHKKNLLEYEQKVFIEEDFCDTILM